MKDENVVFTLMQNMPSPYWSCLEVKHLLYNINHIFNTQKNHFEKWGR